jgi:(E)-4-hydroxy-3-methylbut-2-enyl-diphosphate synthase
VPESQIVETLIEEAMRIADDMGIEVGEDGSVSGPGAQVVVS